jgi:H+/Cl- antiporter ClcA
LKSILSGVVLPRYLTYRTFLAKTVALIFVLSGGISVGREAPFVHISGIIANKLAKIRFFAKSRTSEAKRFRMLNAGCAAGVSCIFGAPIGGVLFSLEVTTTYFLVQNLWRAFFCSVMGALTVKIAGASGLLSMFPTHFDADMYRIWELVVFVFMGLTFGYVGSLFVRLVLKMVHLRRDYKILAETCVKISFASFSYSCSFRVGLLINGWQTQKIHTISVFSYFDCGVSLSF